MSYYRIQTADRDPQDLITTPVTCSWDNTHTAQDGVSACGSVEELAEYLATTGIPFGEGEWVLVELDGDRNGQGHDGEDLIIPTEILSVQPLTDDFYDMVGAAFDALAA